MRIIRQMIGAQRELRGKTCECLLRSGEHVAFKAFYVCLDEVDAWKVVLSDEIVQAGYVERIALKRKDFRLLSSVGVISYSFPQG